MDDSMGSKEDAEYMTPDERRHRIAVMLAQGAIAVICAHDEVSDRGQERDLDGEDQ